MIKKKKPMVMTVVICCFLFSVTALAVTRDSKGWNVYNSSGTVYANVGVTYVSDTFAGKAVVSYVARALGQDAFDTTPISGTKKISASNSYVRVVVTIDDGSGTQYVYLD